MNTERIAVPEVLFQPSLVGMDGEGGLHDAIAQAIAACPPAIQPALWSSIILTGGNAHLPGLEARLARELAPLAPSGSVVQLYTPSDPHLTAWRSASLWAASCPADLQATSVTRQQYQEEGPRACARLFRLPKRGSSGLWPVASPMHELWAAECEADEAEDAGYAVGSGSSDYYYAGGAASSASSSSLAYGGGGAGAPMYDDYGEPIREGKKGGGGGGMGGGGYRPAVTAGTGGTRSGRAAAAQAAAAITRTLAQ